jgi:NTE family protein
MRVARKQRTIGLALGGGGARGLAHIGIIKALVNAGLRVDFIAGTSMGAVVGGLYAAKQDLETVESVFDKMKRRDVYPVGRLLAKRDGALFRDASVAKLLEDEFARETIEHCEIPFAAVATDVKNGDAVVLKEGRLIDAIRASIALPLMFQPVRIGDRLLMDGGFSNPVPADVVRAMGADYVIAVDVTSQWVNIADEHVSWRGMYDIVSNALGVIEYQISREILKKADIVLRPPVTGHTWLDFDHADAIISAGLEEVRTHLREICSATGHPVPQETALEKIVDFIRGN